VVTGPMVTAVDVVMGASAIDIVAEGSGIVVVAAGSGIVVVAAGSGIMVVLWAHARDTRAANTSNFDILTTVVAADP